VNADFVSHALSLERSLEGSRVLDIERWGSYQTYAQVMSELSSLHRARPESLIPEKYGGSADGLPLWAFRWKIRDAGQPRRLLLVGCVHAQEYIGVEVLLSFLHEVVASRGERAAGIDEIVLAPVLNVDGYREVEAALLNGRGSFQRFNARGVDLNRNFPVHFDKDFWLHRLLKFFYHPGDEPASEPETRALMSLAEKYRPRRAVSLHSFGECLFWPYSGVAEATKREDEYRRWAKRMIKASPRNYRASRLGTNMPWFKAKGSEIDYLHEMGALSFLIEIGNPLKNMRSPKNWFKPFAWYNPHNVDEACRVVCPMLHELTGS